jgi:hypothetical protein
MSKTLPYELREMIFTKLLFHDSECEMPDLIYRSQRLVHGARTIPRARRDILRGNDLPS